MLKQYTIDQLVEEVNRIITENKDVVQTADGRLSELITVRKVRDLLSKRLINNPVKDGRQNYFDNSHVEQILNIKTLQKEGASEKLLRGLSASSYLSLNEEDTSLVVTNNITDKDSELQANAMSVLNSINARSITSKGAQLESAIAGSIMPQINSHVKRSTMETLILGSSATDKPDLLRSGMSYAGSHKNSVKVFSEYPLDDNGKLFLKMEQGYTVTNKEEMLEKIKQILGLGE
jgi:hypothetical protein